MLKWLIFCSIGLCLGVNAAEKPSVVWQKKLHSIQRQQRAALHNDHVPHLWSDNGQFFYYRWTDPQGTPQWHSYELSTGKIKQLSKRPIGTNSRDLDDLGRVEVHPYKEHKSAHSPDKKWKVSRRGDGLFLNDKRLDFDLPRGSRWKGNFVWSPDSSAVIAWHNTTHPVREVHYIRTSPNGKLQPEHFSIKYPKPGDLLNVPRPVVFFTDGRQPMVLDEAISKNPYSLDHMRWSRDSSRVTFDFVERGFGKYAILELNVRSRKQRTLVSETSNTFVFVGGNCFRANLSNDRELLWLSQRTGFNHLYLLDMQSGKMIRQLTRGRGLVRKVVRIDEKARCVFVQIAGCYPDQDPYHLHYARIDLDSGKITPLTSSDGTHKIFVSPSQKYYLAKWSRVDHPPVHELREFATGKLIKRLPTPNTTALLQTGWQLPERFVCKDRNGKHDIHGVILRPPNFDPNKKYPVIEHIYAGPHGSFTPRTWTTWFGNLSELAAEGFIVVQLDGLGTNHRGKDFHDVAYKNLKDSGFPDRIKWIRRAAQKYPQLDLTKVGIYGGSAGGQSSTAALLHHGDFYKVAVSDCGCHDNRMDKIWWNEQWMDWPVGKHYVDNSNITHAHKLRGALMLTVGEVDTNVDPASTYQLVNALLKADKDFVFYPIPNGGHGAGEELSMRYKRMRFFQKHFSR